MDPSGFPIAKAARRIAAQLSSASGSLEKRVSAYFEQLREPVYRYLAAAFGNSAQCEDIHNLVLEEDVSAVTLRRIRKGSIRRLADGRIGREEARSVSFTESSIEEFNANDLSRLIAETPHVVRITPEELFRRKGLRP